MTRSRIITAREQYEMTGPWREGERSRPPPLQSAHLPLTDLISPHGDMAGVLDDYDNLGHRSETPDDPIYVKARHDIPGKYEIADGHHRVADAIRNGRDHVRALIDPYEDEEPYEAPFYDFSQHMGDKAVVQSPTVPVRGRAKNWRVPPGQQHIESSTYEGEQ